jgi:hypothetical protein
MADPAEIAKEAAEKLKGKKAKVKKLITEPEGTKGKPLPGPLKKALEESLGAKLDKVRVHTGGNAAQIAKELGAKAFTIGQDIYFGKSSDGGKVELIAHELTHVVQQGNGKMPKVVAGKALTSK